MTSPPRCDTIAAVLCLAVALAACDPDNPTRVCATDQDCTAPARCGPDGVCAVPSGFEDGAACQTGEQCQSRFCFDAGKGAACSRTCQEPAACAAGQVCVPVAGAVAPASTKELRLLCSNAASGALFLGEACEEDAACRSNLCEGKACTRPCGTCPEPMVCEKTTVSRGSLGVSTGVCKTRLLELLDLGAVSVAQTSAAELPVTIPAGVDSFLVYADDADDLRVALTRLEAPDRTVLFDQASPATALMRAWEYLGTATAQVPGTDSSKARVQAGVYKVSVRTFEKNLEVTTPIAGNIERVAAVWRRSRQKGGLLDLDLHFAPATGVKAATAATSTLVTEALAELRTLFRNLLGIGLGEVRFFDLTAAEDTVASADAARAIRKTRSQLGPHGLTVSVFVVKSIGYGFEAVAGGMPGVPALAGRPSSGIVAEVQATGKSMGRLLAHEIGHYLGLFHTTEAAVKGVDPIEDTPSCPTGIVPSSGQSTTCPDRQNLMFPWYLNLALPELALSAGQASVVRGSPFLHEIAYPDACGSGVEVVDVTASGFASGMTGEVSRLSGSCGGSGAGERVHLYRAKAGQKTLEVEVVARGFDPVVYALKAECSPGAAVACQAGSAGAALKVMLTAPEPGPYFIVVDGASGAGSYTLVIRAS